MNEPPQVNFSARLNPEYKILQLHPEGHTGNALTAVPKGMLWGGNCR